MAEFTLSEILRATQGVIVNSGNNERITGVTTDTRSVRGGDLFIALKGERFDGHDFIEQAVKKGAAAILVSQAGQSVDKSTTVIRVDDTLKAFQGLARFHRQRFDIPLVAVTGSNGKTTTKDMIAAVLSSKFNSLKTEANYNNEIGLPMTLLKLNSNHDVAIVEMGMRGAGQIAELAGIAIPNVAVITNVGETHIELLGSVDNIAAAKAELVEALPANGIAVLNYDNDYVRAMREKTHSRVLFYGTNEKCDIRGVGIETHNSEMCLDVKYSDTVFRLLIPTIGRHNVYNALAATAVGLGLGLSISEIEEGIKHFVPSAMRLAVETIGDYVVVNDAYNASPLSMAAAIDTLAEIALGRKVVILGDMLELGHIAVDAHQRIGRKLGQCGVDIVVTVGHLASFIADEAGKCGAPVTISCQNHEQAAKALHKHLLPGDTILVKGSRGMQMEKILEVLS